MSNKQRLDFQNNDQVKEFSLKILKSESVDELKKILKDLKLKILMFLILKILNLKNFII